MIGLRNFIIGFMFIILIVSTIMAEPGFDAKTYESGNRIWDEDMNLSHTYTWTPQSFSGFYYNPDTDEGKETLTIRDIDRSIDSGNIKYVSEPIVKEFECNSFGNYYVIGFMAERYFAGYEEDSIMNDGSALWMKKIKPCTY
jgi:hypothetical protein